MTAYLLLAPITWEHAEDAVPIRSECGHQCWIGPTSMSAVLHPLMKTQTICVPCAIADPEKRESLFKDLREEGMSVLPGTREELTRSLGKQVADDLYQRFRMRERLP